MANLLRIAGRTAFGLLFVLGGMKLQDPEGTIAYTAGAFASSGVTGALASFGLDITPFIPIMFYIATALEVLGGLALIFGAEKLGAALLFAFLVSVCHMTVSLLGPPALEQRSRGSNGLRCVGVIAAATSIIRRVSASCILIRSVVGDRTWQKLTLSHHPVCVCRSRTSCTSQRTSSQKLHF